MSTLWSGRFASAPDQDVFAFGASFAFDRRLFDDDVEGSRAWAEALLRAGVLSADEQQALDARADRAAARPPPPIRRSSRATTRTCIRSSSASWSSASARPASVCIPVARATSRWRSISGCTCAAASACVQQQLRALVAALCARAADAGEAPLPAYTHLRRAQPVLEAHYWLAHASAFRRACERFDAVYAEADALPLGSGAIAGNSFPIDVEFLRDAAGLLAHRRQQHGRGGRPRLRRRASCTRARW